MPNYRYIAKLYRWCEEAVFGDALQKCRTAFIKDLSGTVVSVGEGDGRFAEVLGNESLIIIEPDAAMRDEAQRRMPHLTFGDWHDVHSVDAVVLNFVLDICTPEELQHLLDETERVLPSHGTIIIGDFFPQEVEETIPRFWAHALVWIMYRFFAIAARTQVMQLPETRKLLSARGWHCLQEYTQWGGFIRAQRWGRSQS